MTPTGEKNPQMRIFWKHTNEKNINVTTCKNCSPDFYLRYHNGDGINMTAMSNQNHQTHKSIWPRWATKRKRNIPVGSSRFTFLISGCPLQKKKPMSQVTTYKICSPDCSIRGTTMTMVSIWPLWATKPTN